MKITFNINTTDLERAEQTILNSVESGWCVWEEGKEVTTFGIEATDDFCLYIVQEALSEEGIKIFDITKN